jgi:dipeptidyl aminopeptidase/acylaminoacyl peptidase
VLFTSDTAESTEFYDDANIEVVVVATGERKTVVRGSSMARFLPPDALLFARGGALFATRFDPRTLEASGSPVPVKQSVATNVASGAAQFDTSSSGALLWIPGGASSVGGTPVWIDRQGAKVPATSDVSSFGQLSLSPDGRRLAVVDQGGVTADLWLVDLAKGTKNRLSFEGNVADPTWSADGERIAYSRSIGETGSADIVWRRADGRGGEEQLVVTPEQEYLGSFSPDGRHLAYERVLPGRSDNDIWILPLGGSREGRPFRETPTTEFNPEFSPDGRWLAYCSFESGRPEVFVSPFPSGDGRWQVSTTGGVEPHWSRDGKELAFRMTGALHVVAIDTHAGFSAGRPEKLAIGLRSGDNSRSYSPAPGGERFVALPVWGLERDSGQINLALGWSREVQRRLAAER